VYRSVCDGKLKNKVLETLLVHYFPSEYGKCVWRILSDCLINIIKYIIYYTLCVYIYILLLGLGLRYLKSRIQFKNTLKLSNDTLKIVFNILKR